MWEVRFDLNLKSSLPSFTNLRELARFCVILGPHFALQPESRVRSRLMSTHTTSLEDL